MDIKQYFMISVYIMGFAGLIISSNAYCPDDQICDCTPESIKCICLQRENIIFQKGEIFTRKEIVVKECGEVKLATSFAKNLVAESFLISDVLKLHIAQYAFKGSSIRKLGIDNISKFSLEPFSLSHIKNVTSLKINNVFLEHLPNFVAWNTEARIVAITNSHVGAILAGAFKMENMKSFLLENNTVDDLSGSIEISNIKKFSFIRNVVKNTGFYSISLYMADKVEFGYCHFLQINSSMIYTRNIELFSFHDNHIESCEKKAFWNVRANTKVSFVSNQIVSANNDSLIPNLAPKSIDLGTIESFNNTFVCDCNLEWLLSNNNPSYNFIKERSVCYDPPYLTNLKLSQLKLSINDVGTCVSVEKRSADLAMTKITKQKPILETSKISSKTEISMSPKSEISINRKADTSSPNTEISTNQKVLMPISPKAEEIPETGLSRSPKSETSPGRKIVASINPKGAPSTDHSAHNEKTHQDIIKVLADRSRNAKTETSKIPKTMTPIHSQAETSKARPKLDLSRSPEFAVSSIQKSDMSTNSKIESQKRREAEISPKFKRDAETNSETNSSENPKEDKISSPKPDTTITTEASSPAASASDAPIIPETDSKTNASTIPKVDSKTNSSESSGTNKSSSSDAKASDSSKENIPLNLIAETTESTKTDISTTSKSEIPSSPKTKTRSQNTEPTTSPKAQRETSLDVKNSSSSTTATTTAKPCNRSPELYISTSLVIFSFSFLIILRL